MALEDYEQLVTLQLPTKIVVLRLRDFDTDIDVDELTQIHYHNLMGELLTCSVAMNRIGNLLADYESMVSEAKLDISIYEAQRDAEERKEMVNNNERPTNEKVEMAIRRSPEWKVKKKEHIRLSKEWGYLNSLYWAIKSKDEKLNKLTDKLRPEDFEAEIVEEKINGIMIKLQDKAVM